MATMPRWAKLETTGTTERGNLGVRLTIKWWGVPYLVLVGIWRALTGQVEDEPDSCDGQEVTETKVD